LQHYKRTRHLLLSFYVYEENVPIRRNMATGNHCADFSNWSDSQRSLKSYLQLRGLADLDGITTNNVPCVQAYRFIRKR